jgi:signal transduction histidine kinase
LGNLLKNQLLPQFNSTIGLLDSNGLILLAYAPVLLNGTHFLSLYTEVSHNLAGDVASAIDQQKNFSILTQSEFIDVAAHELRTPMQPIIGLTAVLRSKLKDAEQRNLLDVIIRNSKRFQHLTEDILDVTRIESHTLAVKKIVFDINDMIMKTVQDYRSQIQRNNKGGNRNLEIFFKPKDGAIFVKADRGRITQVISNLIDNAIKFTSQDNRTLKITTEKRIKSEHGKEAYDYNDVIVSVKDNGSGIDPEIMPNLFSKFATKSFAGTGLGLYISRNIIEAHEGKIWAENNKSGKGATFYFSLPNIKNHLYQQQKQEEQQ